jgi:hypothetical protein
VTITGAHLGKVAQVVFGAVGPAQFTLVNDKTITAVAPLASANDFDGFTTDVTLISAGGIPSPSVAADQFTYTSVLPVITSVSPSSGEIGTTITITGAHLTGTTFVGVGSLDPRTGATFTVLDDSTISAVIPPWYSSSGQYMYDMIVQTNYGVTSQSAADQFTQLPIPPPTFTGITPPSGPVGTLITITGTRLTLPGVTSKVQFAGCVGTGSLVPAPANPDGSISATVPACAQTGPLIVFRWDSGYYTTPLNFTVTVPPGPPLASVSPSSGPATGGTTILIKGTDFTGATAVSVGDQAASFTILDDGDISAVTPDGVLASSGQSIGTVDVRVTASSGQISAITPADQFTYLPATETPTPVSTPIAVPTFTPLPVAPLTLTGFAPSSGPVGALITLSGTNLTTGGGASVLFTGCSALGAAAGSVPASPQADGTLTVTVPACAQTGPLIVFTVGGSATSAESFTVT